MTTSVIEYEKYELLIDSIRMQFYNNFSSWRNNLDLLRNFRDKTLTKDKNDFAFSVIDDCWMKFIISVKQKKAGLLMLSQE